MSSQTTVSIRITGDSSGLNSAVDAAQASLRKLDGQAQATGAAAKTMTAAVDGVSPSLQDLNKNAQTTGTGVDRLSAAMGRVGHYGVAAISLTAVAKAAFETGNALFMASAKAQNLTTQLNFATDGNGARELAFVTQLANRLGLQISSTAQAYAGFAAATRGTALEGAATRAVFESMAKASAVMGLSADQSTGALLAVQQMMSKGVVSAEEFRGQLGERMPIALQAGAKALGVTTEEFSKLLETGQIVAADFLPKFASAIDTMLAGSVEDAAKRLDASAARMANSWEKLKQTVGDSGVSSAIAREMTAISQDMTVATEAMQRIKDSGGGMFSELAAGAGVLAGRTGFAGLNLAANTLNGTINTLTGGVIGLRTDLAILPDFLKTNAVKAAELAQELPRAEAELAALQARFGKSSPNIYIQDQLVQLGIYVDKLREAKREQSALAGAAVGGGRGTVNPQTVGAQLAQQEKDLAAANALRLKVSGVPEGYTKDMQEVIRLYQAGALTGEQYTEVLGQMQTQLLKKTGATTGAASAEKSLQSSYESILTTVSQKLAAQNQELTTGRKLNDSDQLRIKWSEELKGKLKGLSAEKKALVEKMLDEMEAGEKIAATAKRDMALYAEQVQMDEERAQALVQESKAREQGRLAVAAYASAIQETAEQIAFEQKLAPATAEQRALAIEHYKIELELKKQIAAIDSNTGFDEAQREEQRARARAASAQARVNASNRAEIEGVRKIEEEGKKSADKIGDQLTDALMRGFESGKSPAENLRDTVENMFNTMVLRPMISAIMNPVAGVVNQGMNAVGLGGSSGGLNGLTNPFGGGGGIASILGNGISSLGTAFGSSAFSAFGAGMASAAGEAALGAAFVGPGAAAAGGAVGMGATIGAAIPYIGLALAAVSLLSGLGKGESRTGGQYGVAFDGAVTNNRRGETYTEVGQQYNRNNSTGVKVTDGKAYLMEADGVGANDAKIKEALASTAAGINAMLKGMGSSAALAQFFGGFETSGKGRGGVMSGGKFADGTTFGESGTGDNYEGSFYEKFSTNSPDLETAIANFSQDLLQSSIQALQKVADAPDAIKKKVKDVDAESLSSEEAQALLTDIGNTIAGVENFRTAMKALPFENLRDLSFDAAAGLIEMSGGIDSLGGKLSSYYNNFYSESERQALALQNVQQAMADLGRADVDSQAEFRALFESQDGKTDAGAKTIAQLLNVEAAFAAVYPAAVDAAAGAEVIAATLAETMAKLRNPGRTIDDVAKNTIGLEDKVWDLENEGNTAALRERQTKGWTDAEKAIQAHIWALEGEKTAAAEAAQQAATIANERKSLERQLLELNGDTVALRALEREEVQEGNRAFYDIVKARQDEIAAAAEAARQAESIANERKSLERQLLELNGDTAALRALERAEVEEANLAFYDLVKARQDEIAAAAEAARQAETIANERKSLERQLLELNGDTAALRALDRAEIEEANRALFDHVRAVEDQKKAAADAATAAQQAAQEQATAAAQIKDLWGGISDSLVDEIKRVRGELTGGGKQGQAYAQAQFDAATARALSGDQEAAKQIPALNKAVLEFAAKTASTELDLRQVQAAQLASMATTNAILAAKYGLAVPAFAAGGNHMGGLRLVGEMGPELEATGASRIYNADQTRALLSGGGSGSNNSAEVVAKLREVCTLLDRLLANSKEGTAAADSLEHMISKLSDKGTALKTVAAVE